MKKLLVTMMCVIMVIAMMPATAMAEESTELDTVPSTSKGSVCDKGDVCTEHVAKIGIVHYSSLNDALEEVESGGTITLINDITYDENGNAEAFNITKSIILDGNNKTISGYGKRGGNNTTLAINNSGSTMVAVEIKNLNIMNGGVNGRALETRGNIQSLTLENCEFDCNGKGNTQVLTVGGNQSTPAEIILDKTTLTAGKAGYPILSFNPMNLTIRNNSILSGYCAVYFKGVNGSEGSHGSVVNAINSNFDCPNNFTKESKSSFGAFVLEDDNITLRLENCNVDASELNTADQRIVLLSSNAERKDKCDVLFTGTCDMKGEIFVSNWGEDANCAFVITGGTYTENPTEYVPSGYEVVKNNDGTFTVQKYVPPYIPSVPSTPQDNVTNQGTAGTDNATTNADLSGTTTTTGNTTTATVDKTTADKIVDKAVANKSEEVVLDATAGSAAAADKTTTAQVQIPTETLGAIAEKTEADVTVKTDVAEVKLDNKAVAEAAEQAKGTEVKLVVEKVKEENKEVHLDIKLVSSDGTVISDFNGGRVSVTVPVPKAMQELKKLVCLYIADDGRVSLVEGKLNADGTYTFVTGHFSTYVIMAEEEAEKALNEQKVSDVKETKLIARSQAVKTKSGKKAIKITWKAKEGSLKNLDGVQIFRSTKKADGTYKKVFTSKSGKYINTSVKKGQMYYYKVRGYVRVDGKLYFTKYSTKAWRRV